MIATPSQLASSLRPSLATIHSSAQATPVAAAATTASTGASVSFVAHLAASQVFHLRSATLRSSVFEH